MSLSLRRLDTSASRADQAFSAIRESILQMEMRPGEPLVEAKLAEALGISKTPVRQALHRLEQSGLVLVQPYKGYFVSQLRLSDAKEVLEIRAVLEGLAVSEACDHLSDADLSHLTAMLAGMREALVAEQPEVCMQLGHAFHRFLIEKAGNGRLASMIDILDDQFHRFRLLTGLTPGRLPRSIDEHARVLDSLRERNAELAEKLMRQHLLAVYDDLSRDVNLPWSKNGQTQITATRTLPKEMSNG